MSDLASHLDAEVLRLERVIPTSPEDLFALWIEPDEIARWWAPDGYEAAVHDLDVRSGGRWRIVLHGADGRIAATGGFFHVVEPARQLAFAWTWEEPNGTLGGKTEVTVNFEPVPAARASSSCSKVSTAKMRATAISRAGRQALIA